MGMRYVTPDTLVGEASLVNVLTAKRASVRAYIQHKTQIWRKQGFFNAMNNGSSLFHLCF